MIDTGKEIYSFSKLNSFWTCKYGYFLNYISKADKAENAFSQYGKLCHSILERYEKGKLELWDLTGTFEREYPGSVTEPFPESQFCDLQKTYYENAITYFNNFQGFGKCKVVCAEEKFNVEVDDWIFTGVIDLAMETSSGDLILVDHKSKSSFKNKSEQFAYARQLYLYAYAYGKLHERYPKKMYFNMFRKGTKVEIKFDESDMFEALNWAKDTVSMIRKEKEYPETISPFFCNNICNFRKDVCPFV